MTTEVVLLLGLYAFIILGVFLGDMGPIKTFQNSTPRLAALIERDIATGTQFKNANDGSRVPKWEGQ